MSAAATPAHVRTNILASVMRSVTAQVRSDDDASHVAVAAVNQTMAAAILTGMGYVPTVSTDLRDQVVFTITADQFAR